MSRQDWSRFEALVRGVTAEAPTQARAQGLVLARLLETAAAARPAPGALDWLDWERQKTLRLLHTAV